MATNPLPPSRDIPADTPLPVADLVALLTEHATELDQLGAVMRAESPKDDAVKIRLLAERLPSLVDGAMWLRAQRDTAEARLAAHSPIVPPTASTEPSADAICGVCGLPRRSLVHAGSTSAHLKGELPPHAFLARDTRGELSGHSGALPSPLGARPRDEHTADDVAKALREIRADNDWAHTILTDELASLRAQLTEAQDSAEGYRLAAHANHEALTEAQALIAALSTPDIIGIEDCTFYEQDDFSGAVEIPNTLQKCCWANRTLGDWWVASVVTAWDEDDGGVAESEILLFPNEAAALAAIADSEAARPVRGEDS